MVDSRRTARQAAPRLLRSSPKLANSLSPVRRSALQGEIENGLLKEAEQYSGSALRKGTVEATPTDLNREINRGLWMQANQASSGGKRTQEIPATIAHSPSFKKQASTATSSGIGSSSGSNVERLAPEVYSPLFVMANLNLPRDRITVNSWLRSFFDLHPLVRNAITLHATYPISKLNIKCADKNVERFFEDMIEEMDLMGAIGDIALDYWKIGEAFPYAELDENTLRWKRIIVENPDYIHVKKMIVASEPVISLRPDAVLQRLVMSNNPADVQLRKQIPQHIIYHVRRGENIPLDNFNVSHLKMLSSPYDVRGTSIIVSAFKDLMLYDKIRECHSIDTEVLTENGFKHYDNVQDGEKIGTFNPETQELEFQNFTSRIKRHHDGDMYHFNGKKLDVLVTPGHRMWLSKWEKENGYGDFNFIEAKDVIRGAKYKSRSIAKWSGIEPEFIEMCNKTIPVEDYAKFIGYLVADGSIRFTEGAGGYSVTLHQSEKSPYNKNMETCFNKVCNLIGLHYFKTSVENNEGFSSEKSCKMDMFRCTRKILAKEMSQLIGCGAKNKHLPEIVKQFSPRLLKIVLEAMVCGDGTILTGHWHGNTTTHRYCTASKQLANDVQEIAFKAGYSPILKTHVRGTDTYYYISWSLDSGVGNFPCISATCKRGGKLDKINYSGDVFCFEVPNSLLVTRRNGHISIQGNCKFAQADDLINPITLVKIGGTVEGEFHPDDAQLEQWRQIIEEAQYDKNFKIITHAGVAIERVGSSGAVMDVNQDMEFIIKNIMWGLMVPHAVIDTESAVYASASIGLEVLRQRYFNFRNMMAKWLVNKIFAPISDLQGFYKAEGGFKKLIVPEVEWNHMNLYDLQDYIQNISSLVTSKQVSLQTLYRSLGLNYEEERQKLRKEAVNDAIRQREEQSLASMSLIELRSLDPEREIMEPAEAPAPVGGIGGGGMPAGEMGLSPMGGPPAGGGGGGPLPGGLPELAPPPGEALTGPGGAGAPPGGGVTPPLGPGGPGGPR